MNRTVAKVFQGWFALFLCANGYLVCAAVMTRDWTMAVILAPGLLYAAKCFVDSGSL